MHPRPMRRRRWDAQDKPASLAKSESTPMDIEFAQQLCELNNRFYSTWSDSFSSTRHNVWPGWEQCLQETGLLDSGRQAHDPGKAVPQETSTLRTVTAASRCSLTISNKRPTPVRPVLDARPLNILDAACGNLRFEAFLARSLPNRKICAYALDACDELALGDAALPNNSDVAFHHCDAIEELQKGILKETLCGSGPMDLAVSFGFMHHIPLPEWRASFLDALLEATKPGGFVCVSLWRFLSNQSMAEKANATTAQGIAELGLDKDQFAEGDRLLSWRNEQGAYRYCHSFSDNEITALVESASDKAALKARFQADGRTGALNEYLVLQRS